MLSTYHKKTLFYSILFLVGLRPQTTQCYIPCWWWWCGLGGLGGGGGAGGGGMDWVVWGCGAGGGLRVSEFFLIITLNCVCVNYNDVFIVFVNGNGNIGFFCVFSYNHL